METLYGLMIRKIEDWSGEVLGMPLVARLSDTALLASPGLVKGDAKEAARLLDGRISECVFLGTRMLKSVSEKNGWILFDPESGAFDAYALTLPAVLPGEMTTGGAEYVDYRMDMLLRHPDAPVPDCAPVLRAVLIASRASARGRWTQQDVRSVLSMTRGLVSFERVKTEHACARAAKIILFERAEMKKALRDGILREGETV